MKRKNTTVNLKSRRWSKSFSAWTEFLWHEHLIFFEQKENNGINGQKVVLIAIFLTWKTFYTLWIQFSWHVCPIYSGEKDYMNFCLWVSRKKKKEEENAIVELHLLSIPVYVYKSFAMVKIRLLMQSQLFLTIVLEISNSTYF